MSFVFGCSVSRYEFSSTSSSSMSSCVRFRVGFFDGVAVTRRCFGPCVFLDFAHAFRCKVAAGAVEVPGVGAVDKQYIGSSVSCGKVSEGAPSSSDNFRNASSAGSSGW